MNILFIANLVPYPLDGGGKIKTFTTIQSLAMKHTIDLVCFYEHEDINAAREALSTYCRNIELIPIQVTTDENKVYIMKQAIKCLLTPTSLSVYKYHKKTMETSINRLIEQNTYDLVFFNILQVYSYKKQIQRKQPQIKVVLDTQNCESLIFKRHAKESSHPLKKLYYWLEGQKLGRFEKSSLLDADKVILLSKEDKIELEKLTGKKFPSRIIPIGVGKPQYLKKVEKKTIDDVINILFIGTLTWAPNNEGIIWFLRSVMPKIKNSNVKLYIVGKNPGEKLRQIACKFNNVEVTGYVDSVDDYYQICDYMIVPLFFGSGQRVKIIEGFAHGMPIISTKIGAEGLEYKNNENILIADDAEEFIKAIELMRDDHLRSLLSKHSIETYLKNYSPEAIRLQLEGTIDALFTKS